MKSDKLFDAIGEARSEYLQDAEAVPALKRYGWVKWAAVAACVMIAVLIAVPALNGKAPEVEEPTEPTSIEEPTNELAEEPSDEPADTPTEYSDITVYTPTDEPVITPTPEGGAGREGGYPRINSVFATYAELAAYIEEPVFEAFLATEEAQRHQLLFTMQEYADASGPNEGKYWINRTEIIIDGLQEPMPRTYETASTQEELDTANNPSTVYVVHYTHYSTDTQINPGFDNAAEKDVLTTYQVDGTTIQKYDMADYLGYMYEALEMEPTHEYVERLMIGGICLEITGRDEAKVDAIAEALAHLAAERFPESASMDFPVREVPETPNIGDSWTVSMFSRGNAAEAAEDPVFAAFLNSDETDYYAISFGTAGSEIFMKASNTTVSRYSDEARANGTLLNFPEAEQRGLIITREVNGCEIQKFNWGDFIASTGYTPNALVSKTVRERVDINGVWYYIEGPEEQADKVADILARVGGQL